jgi:hypothetical protein
VRACVPVVDRSIGLHGNRNAIPVIIRMQERGDRLECFGFSHFIVNSV